MKQDVGELVAASAADPPVLLTVAEVAGLLRIRPNSLYLLIAEGTQPPGLRRVGKRAIRWHRATLVQWLDGRERVPREPKRKP